ERQGRLHDRRHAGQQRLHPLRGVDALVPERASRPDGQADRQGDGVVRHPRAAARLPRQQEPGLRLRLRLPRQRDGCSRLAGSRGIVEGVATVYTVVLLGSAVFVLVRRWRGASGPARRVLLPVYLAGTLTLIVLLLGNVLDAIAPGAAYVFGALFL